MASTLVKSQKILRRAESKKSHSWWWDSHVSPKNSKWLAENLEEMDQSVKRMLKLIEEEGDSFAKKAEMYYQKRPELVSHVEDFYRMYRSLAERYDNVTGELRKNIPSDLQSQGSGISEVGSDLPSTWPSPEQRLGRRKSGPRAAGFDVFLGNGGSGSDFCNKEADETSTLDSVSDSDDDASSVNNYSSASGNGDDQLVLRKKITELEVGLGNKNGNSEGSLARIAEYEEELRVAKEKIRFSEEEVTKLRIELENCGPMLHSSKKLDSGFDDSHEDAKIRSDGFEFKSMVTNGIEAKFSDQEVKIHVLEEELKTTAGKLLNSVDEVKHLRHELESNVSSNQHLQDKLGSAQKDVSSWKAKIEKERREISKLQDRIVRYKANLAERDQEIRALRETVSNANKSLSEENSRLQAEITRLVKERAYLEDNLKEWDLRCQCLEEDLRRAKVGKTGMEAEIEQLKTGITEKDECIKQLHISLDELDAKVAALTVEVSTKDHEMDEMSKDLHQLHIEHVGLVSGIEKAHKSIEELTSRSKELEGEVEKQREVITEGAEEKREAIRQLCFSLEHYRNGYHMLRQAFVGHKRVSAMAS